MTWVQNGKSCTSRSIVFRENPREILHGLKAVQDDAGEECEVERRSPAHIGEASSRITTFSLEGVILNPGFSRVKDLARVGTGARSA